jgi:hypothetical protein
MNPEGLRKDGVYFLMSYENESEARPIVRSYIYTGTAGHGTTTLHLFSHIGSGDILELLERQLKVMLTLEEFQQALGKWGAIHHSK